MLSAAVPAGIKVKVYESIEEIPEIEWDSIVGKNRLICTHNYLRAIEKSRINDCRFFYPVIYDGDTIASHTAVYFISTELDTFAQGVLKKAVNLIRSRWKGFFMLRSLECGTPVALGNTISMKSGANRTVLLRLLVREIERLAKRLRINVVLFRDFYDEELGFFDYMKKMGYTRIHNLQSTKLEIRWSSFRGYMDSMRSEYKYKISKRMRSAADNKIDVEVVYDFSEYGKDLEVLWNNVYNNAKEYRRERLAAVFFENINAYLGGRSAVIVAKKGCRVIGFALLLLDDETLIPLFFGLDYCYNKDYNVYFNLMYKAVEVGIERGMREIDMGITTLVPKKDIGCSPVTLNMYMKHFNPLLNRIVPGIFDLLTPQDTKGPRNVFKAGE